MAITNRHNPAVLVIGHTIGEELAHWALPEKLAVEYGINVGGMSIQHLVRGAIDRVQALRPFNAVIICGLSLLNPDAPDDLQNDLTISQARLNRLIDILTQYVTLGGGLYIYGHSFVSAGNRLANATLNQFSKRLGAELIFES